MPDPSTDPLPVTLQLCEACGSEGRIYHAGHSYDPRNGEPTGDWDEECPCCEGTGGALMPTQPVTEPEIMEPSDG